MLPNKICAQCLQSFHGTQSIWKKTKMEQCLVVLFSVVRNVNVNSVYVQMGERKNIHTFYKG